jgi:1,4-dihydroxy-6-naphthoate synthase
VISLAFSPCPNDTYIFDGLVHRRSNLFGVDFAKPVLADVESLNNWAMQGVYDVTKLSFHAYGHVRETYQLLQSGAALGRGCGPLLVSRTGDIDFKRAVIAIPGELTTAAMLLKLFAPCRVQVKIMTFDTIMQAIVNGEVDAGVIIHESRFTYRETGLQCVQDLGVWWEESTGFPIPLGGIAAKKSLGSEIIKNIDSAINASILHAHAHPQDSTDYINDHSQEIEPEVTASHIKLYVNSFSTNLGEEGNDAVKYLLRQGHERKLF